MLWISTTFSLLVWSKFIHAYISFMQFYVMSISINVDVSITWSICMQLMDVINLVDLLGGVETKIEP
jgi:hypothetical protein